jgi:flotillin
VEELYKDRAAFSERVREHVYADVSAIGFVLLSYTVTKIADHDG